MPGTHPTPEQIRRLRLRLQRTIPEFAALVGVSGSTVEKWEAGKTRPLHAFQSKLMALASEQLVDEERKDDEEFLKLGEEVFWGEWDAPGDRLYDAL